MAKDASTFASLKWRDIGPPRGGRVVAVAGHPTERATFYFGACGGGVWKTTDGGAFWENVTDGQLHSSAVGAIAVSASDPNVVYAGMGESCVRNDVIAGDGVYRTIDGGHTWHHLGLEDTRHISRVRIDPSDPDRVFVAALGDIFGPSDARGVYRTTDGGATWERVLRTAPSAGAADLWLDPLNPRLLYASVWEAERKPWSMSSGGPASGLWRSHDGGSTWEEITRRPGLPKRALLGRMGICASPAPGRNARVWALVEAADGESGLYRSDDYGDNWHRVSEDKAILGRPWYYSHIVPDPTDADTIYALNFQFWKSTDSGRTFREIPTPHGDNHDLWIDPADPKRMIEGNDGGACVTFNAGETFSTIYNQPTGQFYHLDLDDRFPYRVYGTQQDNSAISVPSRSRKGAILWDDCYPVGHSESGYIAVDPSDPNIVFSGAVGSAPGGGGPMWRYDHRSGQSALATIWPEYWYGEDMGNAKHRFPWTYPIVFSPNDPRVLYACGERVFRSADSGQSWEAISDDLTRNDADKLKPSGGPISKDTSGAEIYCTVYSFAESPHEPGVLWAGSDDGLVHLSRDGGEKWLSVTPPDLPEWATVTALEVSPHDPATVYLCAHRYRVQDNAPYLFKTTNYGESWTRITSGLPADEWTRIVRADPVQQGLLYAGTERGVWVSFDDGNRWTPMPGGLPPVPVYDLKVKHGDLVAATHGRGFWIFDHLVALREHDDDRDVAVAAPDVVWRYPTPPGSRQAGAGVNYLSGAAFRTTRHPDGVKQNRMLNAGTNPPDGVSVYYWLSAETAAGDVELRFLDADGGTLAAFHPKPDDSPADVAGNDDGVEDGVDESGGEPDTATAPEGAEGEGDDISAERADPMPAPTAKPKPKWWEHLPRAAGLNHFTWDLRGEGVRSVPDREGKRDTSTGFRVPPGTYTVELRAGDEAVRCAFELRRDPTIEATDQDLIEQHTFLLSVRDRLNEVNAAIGRVRALKAQAGAWGSRADAAKDVKTAAKALSKALEAVEALLTQPKYTHDTDRLKMPAGLDVKVRALTEAAGAADRAPTRGVRDVFAKLDREVDAALDQLAGVESEQLAALNDAIRASGVAVVAAP